LQEKGNKVYHLNIGQPDIKTPEVAMNAVRNFDIKVLEYSHSAGFESYRSKLSQFYKSRITHQCFEDIIITGGSGFAFAMVARWILEMKSSSQNHFTQITMVFSAASELM
jgi:aspartate aminotransferase